MEIDKVKELVRLMVDNDLSSISVRDGDEEITLNRSGANGAAHGPIEISQPLAAGSVSPGPAVHPAAAPESPQKGPEEPPKEDALNTIDSPMVGTFYASPNPDADPFVQVGARVSAATVVCIIEAMKVFNEIRAEKSGTIEKVLVTNQQAVEYGQPLFQIRPD